MVYNLSRFGYPKLSVKRKLCNDLIVQITNKRMHQQTTENKTITYPLKK